MILLIFIISLILILGYFLFFKKKLIEHVYYINRIEDVRRGKHMINFLKSMNLKGERSRTYTAKRSKNSENSRRKMEKTL